LGFVRQVQCAAVSVDGFGGASDLTQQLGTGGVKVRVVIEGESIGDPQAGFGPLHLGDGDRPVQLDDGRPGDQRQLAVESG
jgi:hypothetical protein